MGLISIMKDVEDYRATIKADLKKTQKNLFLISRDQKARIRGKLNTLNVSLLMEGDV